MKVCGQTLILVDTDIRVSEINRQIIKATLEYMFMNSPDNRAYCLQTYGYKPDFEENYTMDTDELYRQCEVISFSERDSSLTDTLCEVISSWRECDFSCRDIVVFTDGLEEESFYYGREELFYLLNNTDYPVYVVDLVQDNNAHVRKELSAIATTSGGKLFFTEFEGDDASVEVQIAEKIFGRMKEYEAANWSVYEENALSESMTDADETEGAETERTEADYEIGESAEYVKKDLTDYYRQVSDAPVETDTMENNRDYSETVILTDEGSNKLQGGKLLVSALAVCFCFIALGLFVGKVSAGKHRKNADNDRKIRTDIEENVKKKRYFEADIDEPGIEEEFRLGEKNTNQHMESDYITRILDDDYPHDNATRILTGSGRGTSGIKLIDIKNEKEVVTVLTDCPQIIGRKKELCDIVFEDDSISKKHCEVGFYDGEYYCKDLESSNGTFINDVRIYSEYIVTGDCLKIGMKEFVVQCL